MPADIEVVDTVEHPAENEGKVLYAKTNQTYLKFASILNHVAYCFIASAHAGVQNAC